MERQKEINGLVGGDEMISVWRSFQEIEKDIFGDAWMSFLENEKMSLVYPLICHIYPLTSP